MNRRQFITSLPFLAFASTASACIWDSDTLARDATGNHDILRVITGRFDRLPPKYYELRLARVASLIEGGNSDPALFDDAGVACDRLGRHDEAILWMEKKNTVLALLPDSPSKSTHTYRYLANLGTFHAHRWLKAADKSNLRDIEKAAELIRAAIKLNPNAHFGREKYQLLALEWIRKVRNQAAPQSREFSAWEMQVPCFLGIRPDYGTTESLESNRFEDASTGLGGIVALGAAWESIDIFYALYTVHLCRSESAIANLAAFRIAELLEAGRKSLDPANPFKPEDAKLMLSPAGSQVRERTLHAKDLAFYKAARAEADQWQKARHAYMEARFAKGQHPDTHPDFWKEWSEPSRPPEFPK